MDDRLQLVIAESDAEVIKEIEETIIRRFHKKAEIHIFTEMDYLEDFLAEERTIELMIVSRDLYRESMLRDGIHHIFMMVSEIDTSDMEIPEKMTVMMRYLPLEEVLEKIDAVLSEGTVEEVPVSTPAAHSQEIVAVYSPIGGCGKSMTAFALARKLVKLDQRVLVVGCDPMQSIAAFLAPQKYAGEELADALKNPNDDTYWTILQNIGQDEIAYLLPFEKSLSFLGIGTGEWRTLIDVLKEKQDFDYLILDVGTDIEPEMVDILNEAKDMVLVTQSGEIAGMKAQKLLKNPDMLPQCECMMVANEFHAEIQHSSNAGLFGVIAPYDSWHEAIEDPIFYRMALKIIE